MLVSIFYSFFCYQLPTLGIYLRIQKEKEQGSILPSLYIYIKKERGRERESTSRYCVSYLPYRLIVILPLHEENGTPIGLFS